MYRLTCYNGNIGRIPLCGPPFPLTCGSNETLEYYQEPIPDIPDTSCTCKRPKCKPKTGQRSMQGIQCTKLSSNYIVHEFVLL